MTGHAMTGHAMPDEGFLRRWARRKSAARTGADLAPEPPPGPTSESPSEPPLTPPAPAAVPVRAVPMRDDAVVVSPSPAPTPAAASAPTMDDVARLTSDSDFSAFVVRNVDAAVRRTALKKLFADPHFNTMDRLDVYIDDYTKPSPVSEAMLASLDHAKRALRHAVDAVADDANADADADAAAAAAPAPPPEVA